MKYNGLGYRTTHIDKIIVNSDGTMKQVTGTKCGVLQIKTLDTFTEVHAATLLHQGSIDITCSGNTAVEAEKGDWFCVSGVDSKMRHLLLSRHSSHDKLDLVVGSFNSGIGSSIASQPDTAYLFLKLLKILS